MRAEPVLGAMLELYMNSINPASHNPKKEKLIFPLYR